MIISALRYFASIFALGFMLGAARTLLIAPRIGATAAVLMELPLMLAASAWLAYRIVDRARYSPRKALVMGSTAFACLMTAEAALAYFLLGQGFAQWAADLFRTPGWVGLAGQIAFALFPLLAALRLRASDRSA